MSLTALAFLGTYFGLLGLSLFRGPIWALGAYFLAFYRFPQVYWWGESLPMWRWSLIAAGVMLLSSLLHHGSTAHSEGSQPIPRVGWYRTVPASLLILITLWMWIQTPWALNGDAHVEGAILFTKYVVLFAVVYRLIDTPKRLEAFLWLHVIGCFLWGWTAFNTNVSGRFEVQLSPDGGDSNTFGYHMGTGVAFAGFLLLTSFGLKRWILLAFIPFIFNGIPLSASRSATVATAIGGVAALYFGPRAKRWALAFVCVLALPLGWMLAGNAIFWDRLNTLTGEESTESRDATAMSRVVIMEANWRMFIDHPFGVGHRGNQILSPQYLPDEYLTSGAPGERGRGSHNSFFAFLVDQGLLGGFFMLSMVIWSFSRVFSLKRLDKRGLPAVLGAYRAALATGLTIHFVAGQFVNLQTAETWIWMLIALACLEPLCREAVRAQEQVAATPDPAVVSTRLPRPAFGTD